jgi:hypothetical protein
MSSMGRAKRQPRPSGSRILDFILNSEVERSMRSVS